tara:strand:- start:4573 stop:4992 length:420 start_codon:yes stop_codon:yes gene_type:complete
MSLVEGHRPVERQQLLFTRGLTQLDGVTKLGKHNFNPSLAIDVYPYDRMYGVLTGHEKNIAAILKKMSPSLDSNQNAVEYNQKYKAVADYIHNRFNIQAGIVMTAARSVGIELTWGGDWNSNGNTADQTFNDLPHFQEK